MRIALLSNVTVEVLAGLLKAEHELWLASGFGAWRETALNVPDDLKAFAPEAVFLLLDASHSAFDDDACASARQALESALPQAVVTAVDLSDLADGVEGFYDERMWKLASMPWSLKGLRAIRDEVNRLCALMHGGAKKALAVDFDNTLWRGVVGEDGVGGIEPDAPLQRALKALQARGVLLVGLSKNNPEDVEPVWDDLRMVLRREDFAALRVDWNEKSANLADCARALNLGLDAFVFCDDNPAERAAMRARCPEVAVPDWPVGVRRLARLYFPDFRVTDEDRARTSQYRAEARREGLRAQADDFEAYLKDLEIRVETRPAAEGDLPRIAQLAQKCNQFNVCPHRYDLAQAAELLADPARLLVVASAGDRFGDLGLIAFVCAEVEGEAATITDFVMSCRAMNRRIEFTVAREVERLLAARGVRTVRATWVPTAKNRPTKGFFENLGFRASGESLEKELSVAKADGHSPSPGDL